MKVKEQFKTADFIKGKIMDFPSKKLMKHGSDQNKNANTSTYRTWEKY